MNGEFWRFVEIDGDAWGFNGIYWGFDWIFLNDDLMGFTENSTMTGTGISPSFTGGKMGILDGIVIGYDW